MIGSNFMLFTMMVVSLQLAIRSTTPMPFEQVVPYRVHIPTATRAELCLLPSIGEKTAEKIIQYRASHHVSSIDDLALVQGISEAKLVQIAPLTTWGDP